MKKNFKLMPLLATAALLLTACSSDQLEVSSYDPNPQPADNAIAFGTYIGKTRAGVAGAITTDSLKTGTHKDAGFGVFAYMKGENGASSCYTTDEGGAKIWVNGTPNFMYNQQVKWDGSAWTYAPVKYWPNDFSTGKVDNKTPTGEDYEATGSVAAGMVSFFAYAPYVAVTPSTGAATDATDSGITALSANTEETEPTVTYKLSGNFSSTTNVDLLWGILQKGEKYGLATGNDDDLAASADMYNTDLTKQNTSEKIKFHFKHALAKFGGNAGLKVVLDVDGNTEANALDEKSNVSIQSIVIKGVAATMATTGKFNIATGKWSSPTLDNSYTSSELFKVDHETSGINKNLITAAGSSFKYENTSWNNTGVTNSAQSVFSESATPSEFYLIPGVKDQELEVTIAYQVRTYDPNLKDSYSTVNQTIKNKVKLPELEPNKAYTLIMHLGLTSVKFEAEVNGWDDAGTENEQVIWLPSNTVASSDSGS